MSVTDACNVRLRIKVLICNLRKLCSSEGFPLLHQPLYLYFKTVTFMQTVPLSCTQTGAELRRTCSRKADGCNTHCRVLRMFWTTRSSQYHNLSRAARRIQYYNNNTVTLVV